MSKFEDFEKRTKMVFTEEETPEKVKEDIIGKEQNAINDFIANLDEGIYKDLNNFPLKFPEKIIYPEYIKMEDFILLSVKDDFYLFPKIFKDKISDYVKFKKYFNNTYISKFYFKKILTPLTNDERIEFYTKYEKQTDMGIVALINIYLFAFFLMLCAYSSPDFNLVSLLCFVVSIFLTLVWAAFVQAGFKIKSEACYMNYEEYFTELLSKLKILNIPLEFFDKYIEDIKVIRGIV